MKTSYTKDELINAVERTSPRAGWDFSCMKVFRAPVPWEYRAVVESYLSPDAEVVDIGTGGGEYLISLAGSFKSGLGLDIDPHMVARARKNGVCAANVTFDVSSEKLGKVIGTFDVVLDRHAPYNLNAVQAHLSPGGYFITQQVGGQNMSNIKSVLHQSVAAPLTEDGIASSSLKLVAFMHYNVEYVVQDIDSLVFWLRALDMFHADIDGKAATGDVTQFNAILEGNVDDRGFVTNEERYLIVAERPRL